MDREVVRVWFCNRRQKDKRLQPNGFAMILNQVTSLPGDDQPNNGVIPIAGTSNTATPS